MSELTVKLVSGQSWVKILPFGDEIGEVVSGNIYVAGDWVKRPGHLTWKEAAETDLEGNTRIGPDGLELVRDNVTGAEIDPGISIEEVPEVEDRLSRWWTALAEFMLEGPEDLVRALKAALSHEQAKESTPGRRKTDSAA